MSRRSARSKPRWLAARFAPDGIEGPARSLAAKPNPRRLAGVRHVPSMSDGDECRTGPRAVGRAIRRRQAPRRGADPRRFLLRLRPPSLDRRMTVSGLPPRRGPAHALDVHLRPRSRDRRVPQGPEDVRAQSRCHARPGPRIPNPHRACGQRRRTSRRTSPAIPCAGADSRSERNRLPPRTTRPQLLCGNPSMACPPSLRRADNGRPRCRPGGADDRGSGRVARAP